MALISIPTNTIYTDPLKRIHTSKGLAAFRNSIVLQDLTGALKTFTSLVEGKTVPKGVLRKEDVYTPEEIQKYARDINIQIASFEQSTDQLAMIYELKPIVKAIVNLLQRFSFLIDDIPSLQGPRRYGNLSRRTWQDALESKIDNWLTELVIDPFYTKDNKDKFLKEIRWYILNAFGSRERLDYGTGHELNFLAFLIGLWKVGIFVPHSHIDGYDILTVFGNYYTIARKLIITYTLEPAGSHGVWGLDDHFHIIYILGASQILNGNQRQISPKFVQDRSVVFQYCEDNLYFNAIAFINKVKKAPFFEHSPILYDVSNVKEWEKILKGMVKMYTAEVLNKFPVVQHFYFGGVLFPWINAKTGKELPISEASDPERDQYQGQYQDQDQDQDQDQNQRGDSMTKITAAPWKSKKSQISFQDKIISSSQSSRLPGRMSPNISGRPGSSVHALSTAGNIETITRAPWARK